jgi:glycosyltransferase involved in cell wall biosynthesis
MAAKPRIAFVANTSWSIYKFRLYLIERLLKEGFSVIVLAPRDAYTEKFEYYPGLGYVELRHFQSKSINPVHDLRLYRELLNHYRSLRPALIFHYTIKANLYGSMAAARIRIPSVSVITGLGYTFARNNWLRAGVKLLYRRILRKNTEVWFLNEDDRRIFTTQKLVPEKKTFLLPGEGVDENDFYPAPHDPGRDEVIFLLIGRLIKHKGIFEFVRAAELLKQWGLNAKCQLLGFSDEQNPVAIPEHQVREWTDKGIITWLGHTDTMPPYIAAADCIVLPSWREGMPLSLLEGASMCKTLIAADTAGCREIVKDGVNGLLCRPRDAADLAEKMAAYCRMPAEAKRRMGLEGRDLVLKNFTRDIVTGIYLKKIDALRAAAKSKR